MRGGADEFPATTRRGTDAYFGNPLRQGRERPLARFLAAYSRYACDDGAFPASRRPRFIFPARRLPRGPSGLRRLDQLGQHPAHIRRVQEGDRRPHGAMPGALVQQSHPARADGLQRHGDVRHPVPDVVNALAPAGQELPDRRGRPCRLQQLDPGSTAGPPAHAEHGLAHPLVLVQLPAGHGEVEDGLVAGDRGLEVVAGDPHVVDLVQHRRLPGCPGRFRGQPRAPPKMSSGWSLGIVADVPPAPHRGGGAAEGTMPEAVITGGARTPIGRLLGSLKDLAATDLGSIVIKAALERSGLARGDVQYVIMGQVLQAGAGQIPSRQAAVAAGIPMTVPSITINKVCLSGLDAIALAAQLVRAGEFDIVVAGGMESMTRAPHLLPGARAGHKYGSAELVDTTAHDGLTDAFDHLSMGESTERHNARLNITREQQDEFAARSHQRAAEAIKNGLL